DGVEDGGAEIVHRELRHDMPRLRRGQKPRVDAVRGLVQEVAGETAGVVLVVEQEEVAGEAEVERLADLVLEALQPADRLEPDADVQLVREQRADAAGAVAGRAAGERLAFEE